MDKSVVGRARRIWAGLSVADHLTPREASVIERAALGMTSKDIAKDLNISVNTVYAHRTAMSEKYRALRTQ